MDTIETIPPNSPSDTRPAKLRRLGVALLAAALMNATSCGSDTETAATVTPSSSVVLPTTTVPPTPTTVPPAPTTTASPRPTAAIDELVGEEGERLHVRCVGQGDTTVLLIAGFESSSDGWVAIEPTLSGRSRVCSYDRPGTGTSDPPTSTSTFTTQATDLHALLTTIGEPGPYVVVGHSFGGAEAVAFVSRFPGEVTGLVLIDATPATWPAALCSVADDGSEAATMLRATCTGLFLPTGNRERLDAIAAFAEVSAIGPLGALPTAVITARDRQLGGLAAPEAARLTDVWNQGQQDWADLSTSAHLVTVDNTGHHIEIDQPAVVTDEITRLLP